MKDVLKRNILACYISDAVLGTFFQLPIWIVYQSKFLSFTEIAFFSGLALISEVVMQLPTGAFADLFGRKLSLSLGNLFMALPMFLIALYPQPEIMWLYSITWGIGRALCMGTSKPMLYESLNKYGKIDLYPKILSRSVVTFQISAALSIASGGYLYQISPALPYFISGTASLIGVFTAFLFIEDRAVASKFNFAKFTDTTKKGFSEIFKNSYMTKLTILFVLIQGIGLTNQQFFTQPFMLELGMNDIQRSWAAMIIKLTIALAGAKMLSTKKLFNNKFFILVIPLLMIISLIPARFVTLPLAYFVLVGIAFTSGNVDLFLSPEIHKHLNNSIRSTSISAQRMLSSTVGAIVQWISAPVIISQSIGHFYSYLGLFALIIIMPLAFNLMNHKHKFAINSVQIPNPEVFK